MTARRDFLKIMGGAALAPLLVRSVNAQNTNSERPNLLWLVSEDNSPLLGCYGNLDAHTPNLDQFAAEGVRYTNAFANAPVCSPARSTLITGMYACSLGTHHMRSHNPIPASIKFFPEYLRAAGYYCSNNPKEDYNTSSPANNAWDESSFEALWSKRSPGQPFFSVLNFNISHESRLHQRVELRHNPATIHLPPYHPDTVEFREDWSQYHDQITKLDLQIGVVLTELAEQNLAQDTIVFYYADHGGVLPRSKRFIYDAGVHVPLIIRFPEKYQHLAPAAPGEIVDRLVSFVDFAPTMLSLANVPVPAYMQGQAFLGAQQTPEPSSVYLFRGRMDERYDMMRGVRTKRFKYIHNYLPNRPYAQHLTYLWQMASMQAWQALYKAGKLDPIQRQFFQTKPTEELYDIEADPHEVNNLALHPSYQSILVILRQMNRTWGLQIRDVGFLPEAEMMARSQGQSPFELGQSPSAYSITRIMTAAEVASQPNPQNLTQLIQWLNDADSGVRYWAAQGCVVLGTQATPAQAALLHQLNDPSSTVRITVAEALCQWGQSDVALPVLQELFEDEREAIRLHVINVIANLDLALQRSMAEFLQTRVDDSSLMVQWAVQKTLVDLQGT
ncbi:MAG: sulfatase-like hydrolase/transferase [Spirulina sp. SIO3F2]|nr:sulfatase-like hydrolase/transferase [Spirulina sp. SIO3F2]